MEELGRIPSCAPGLGGDSGDTAELLDRRWLAALARLRRRRAASDADWDRVYPRRYRNLSSVHFTPVAVARRAAVMLSAGPHTRILDVGAGVGKFCAIAALTAPGIFVGIERRGEMVDIARSIAHRARTPGVRFVHGDAEQLDWGNFDGFYLFNPFGELQWSDDVRGRPWQAERGEYQRLVSLVEERLWASRVGTRVVTFHGFGGMLPPCFRLVIREHHGSDSLEYWKKR
jgi:SAM-dependent methyltransferase